jgi:hypothetical protein
MPRSDRGENPRPSQGIKKTIRNFKKDKSAGIMVSGSPGQSIEDSRIFGSAMLRKESPMGMKGPHNFVNATDKKISQNIQSQKIQVPEKSKFWRRDSDGTDDSMREISLKPILNRNSEVIPRNLAKY